MSSRTSTDVRESAPGPVRTPSAPTIPRPPLIFVRRPRLDAFLDEVPDTPLTVISAPAGSGKTAAVAAWNERFQRVGAVPVTWLRPEQAGLLERQIGVLRNRTDRSAPPIIVIDDAHLLAPDSAEVLRSVLAEDPESVRLLLIGRREPGFIPVSAALAGHVRPLRVDDLRFTRTEAVELVRAHFPDGDDNAVTAVLDQGDGWAAALVLGALALQTSGDTADASASLAAARQPLLDYLLHEVFESLAPELTQVLLTTCQEDHVTADSAVLLSAVPDAPELLSQAAGSGLLVTGYRDERGATAPGWRYHPLLLDLLRRRTAPSGPDWMRIVEAHQRATAAYVDRRDPSRAVRHARLTGDLDLQLRVLREFSTVLISQGRASEVAEVLGSIPVDIRSQHQELLVLQATLHRARLQVDAAKEASDRALAADAGHLGSGVSRDVEAQLAMLDLWQARYGWRESAPALLRAQQVLGCRHDGEVSAHDITGIPALRASWLTMELASFQTWLGELELAAIHVQDAAMYSHQVDLPLLERSVLAHQALLELTDGAYQSGLTSADAALAIGNGELMPDLAAARAHLTRGWARFQELQIADAEAALVAFEATPRELLDPTLLVYVRLLRACILTARGDVAAARRVLDSRGDVPQLLPLYLDRLDRMVRLLVSVALGDLAGLEAEARSMSTDGLAAEAMLGEAVVLGLTGEEHRAVRLLDSLLPLTVDAPATVGLGAAVARVAILQRIGTAASLAAAQDLVPDLLSRAAPQRLLWMLSLGALISPSYVDLLAAQAESAVPHPFAAEAVTALRGHPRPYSDVATHRAAGPVPGVTGIRNDPDDRMRTMLTARELEVLEQLALGGANADLARALFVSENTVKTHLASIYRKLGVERRVDALRVARARGLI